MIGSCPNIAFATVKLLQQMTNPSVAHYRAEMYLLRYLNRTKNYKITYSGSKFNKHTQTLLDIKAFSNSDQA